MLVLKRLPKRGRELCHRSATSRCIRKFKPLLDYRVSHDAKDGSGVGVLWIAELLVEFTEDVCRLVALAPTHSPLRPDSRDGFNSLSAASRPEKANPK